MNQTEIEILEDDVDLNIRRNNYKLTADKIKQILSKVLNDPTKSYRRWVWELMQNAKDVPNTQFQKVSVQIVLEQDCLHFKHNGDPFVIHNLTGLIQQVSSKASDSSDEAVTGKFGTGFISTHLLSEVIEVHGFIRHKGVYRKFDIELDRAGKTSEELLPKIEQALERIRQIENDDLFPVAPNYLEQRKEHDYDTVFTYKLSSDEKRKAAAAGIEDLINTLPLTLVNIGKIKQVEVINKLNNSAVTYQRNEVSTEGKVSKITVPVSGNLKDVKCFVAYKEGDVELVAEVNSFINLDLVANFGQQPNLYRDFPLIGSEKFYFPYVLNGTDFFPTEDRDGIYLNSVESLDAEKNRSIVQSAIQAAIDFSKWLIEKKAKNRYICAFSRKPDYSWEEFSLEWFQNLQKDWRRQLLDLPLVETQAGQFKNLRECIIPNHGATKEAKLEFHRLATLFLGEDKVPRQDILLNWVDACGPKDELEEWGHPIQCDLKSFVKLVEDQKTITTLLTQGKLATLPDITIWLNDLYKFIQAEGSELLPQYEIIPNQYGSFKKLEKLCLVDKEKLISEHFLDILKSIGADWRTDLIRKGLEFTGLNLEKRGMDKASETINKELKITAKNGVGISVHTFLNRADVISILSNIISVFVPNHTSTSARYKLFAFGKQALGLTVDEVLIAGSDEFEYRTACELFIELINLKISGCVTVAGLATHLNTDEVSAIEWLNKYLTLLKETVEYVNLLKTGNIIPNRYGNLAAYDDIANFGTKENRLDNDLIEILLKLDNKKDWKKLVVIDGINIELPKTKVFEELGIELETEIKRVQGEETSTPGCMEKYREPILDLIEWCGNNKRLAEQYLSHIDSQSSKLFFTLTIGSKQISKEVISMLKDEKSIELLTEISNSGLNVDEVRELLASASRNGTMDQLLEHAKELEDEKLDFKFKLDLGNQMEDLFKAALIAEGIEADVIAYQGVGSNDFTIHDKVSSKKAFIELKSYKYDNLTTPIRLAMSQARLAISDPENFALCVIARPHDINDVDVSYISQNLGYLKNINADIEKVVRDAEQVSTLASPKAEISVEVKDPSCKIRMSHSYINSKKQSFSTLIVDLKALFRQTETLPS